MAWLRVGAESGPSAGYCCCEQQPDDLRHRGTELGRETGATEPNRLADRRGTALSRVSRLTEKGLCWLPTVHPQGPPPQGWVPRGLGFPGRHLREVSLGALAAMAEAPRTCRGNGKKQRALFKTGVLNSAEGENC